MQVWILTFNRPKALTRQILTWGRAGYDVHVFSNHPKVAVESQEAYNLVCGDPAKQETKENIHYNSLSDAESNSWCARSWNSIFIKAFKTQEEVVFVQDDTECHPDWPYHLHAFTPKLDFIWGPAGDTFFYMKKEVLKRVGYFDERYLGCYCGDADFMLRTWRSYRKSGELNKLSIEETHDWGWIHNPIGIRNAIRWDIHSKAIDPTYVNQHEEMEAKFKVNKVLQHSQGHFKDKWGFPGNGINGIGPLKDREGDHYLQKPMLEEIDWYPWFTEKYLNNYDPNKIDWKK
jgi:hypothetical protein